MGFEKGIDHFDLIYPDLPVSDVILLQLGVLTTSHIVPSSISPIFCLVGVCNKLNPIPSATAFQGYLSVLVTTLGFRGGSISRHLKLMNITK